jgi:transcription initiation factor TFIIIB Brf1 subunit/transcription initiation factor TFIIB
MRMDLQAIWEQADAALGFPGRVKQGSETDELICKFCGNGLVFGAGELPVCGTCARVVETWLSDEAEWTGGADDDDHDPSRVGAPVDTDLYSEKWGMNTMMVGGSKLLAKINMHSAMNHKDRALFHAYDDIQKAANTIGLPEVVTRAAKLLYRKFNNEKLTRGAVRTGIKANCLLVACKMNGVSRTTQEIADAFSITTTDISRTINMFKQATNTQTMAATFASDLLTRKLMDLNVRGTEKMKVINLCKSVEKTPDLIGKTPKCVACTVTYVALGTVHKSDVCKVFDVSVPTLSKLEPLVKQAIKDFDSSKK